MTALLQSAQFMWWPCRFELKPVVQKWIAFQGSICISHLGSAFLCHWSSDRDVASSAEEDLYGCTYGICSLWKDIWTVFGESCLYMMSEQPVLLRCQPRQRSTAILDYPPLRFGLVLVLCGFLGVALWSALGATSSASMHAI